MSRLHSWSSDNPGQAKHAEADSQIILQPQVMTQSNCYLFNFSIIVLPATTLTMTATHPTKATRRSDFNSFSQKCLLIQINNLISIFKHGLNIQVTKKIPHMNQFYVLAHPLLWLLQLPLWPEQIGSSATSNINEQL